MKTEMDVNDLASEINVVLGEALDTESEVIRPVQGAIMEFDTEEESYDDDDDPDAMEQLVDEKAAESGSTPRRPGMPARRRCERLSGERT